MQSSLPDGPTKQDMGRATSKDETDRGSKIGLRWLMEKVKSSKAAPNLSATDSQGEVVDLSDASAKDKVYCIGENIFLAMRDVVPVPPKAESVYNDKIKYRLMKDIEKALQSIELKVKPGRRSARDPNQFVSESLELRMSGRATGGRNGQVVLRPTIWVRCSKHQQAGMKKALKDDCMAWAHCTEFGEVMVGDAAKLR